MSLSAAALSEQDVSYTSRLSEAKFRAPAGLEDWKAELWRRAEQRLGEIFLLEDDWDGAGAEAPSFGTLATAWNYLRNLYSESAIPPTTLSLTALGSIVLEWRLGDSYLEAEISGPDAIGWMKRDLSGRVTIW